MLCSQSDTNLATIPWTISSVKKYFPDPNVLAKKNGLKSLHLSEVGERYKVKQNKLQINLCDFIGT